MCGLQGVPGSKFSHPPTYSDYVEFLQMAYYGSSQMPLIFLHSTERLCVHGPQKGLKKKTETHSFLFLQAVYGPPFEDTERLLKNCIGQNNFLFQLL